MESSQVDSVKVFADEVLRRLRSEVREELDHFFKELRSSLQTENKDKGWSKIKGIMQARKLDTRELTKQQQQQQQQLDSILGDNDHEWFSRSRKQFVAQKEVCDLRAQQDVDVQVQQEVVNGQKNTANRKTVFQAFRAKTAQSAFFAKKPTVLPGLREDTGIGASLPGTATDEYAQPGDQHRLRAVAEIDTDGGSPCTSLQALGPEVEGDAVIRAPDHPNPNRNTFLAWDTSTGAQNSRIQSPGVNSIQYLSGFPSSDMELTDVQTSNSAECEPHSAAGRVSKKSLQDDPQRVRFHLAKGSSKVMQTRSSDRSLPAQQGMAHRVFTYDFDDEEEDNLMSMAAAMQVKLGDSEHAKVAATEFRKKGRAGKTFRDTKLYQFVNKLVRNVYFDTFFAVLIMANAVLLGVQADYFIKTGAETTPVAYRVLDLSFCVLFVIELALRIFVFRCKFFYISGWGWNWFDLIIVMLQIIEEAMLAVANSLGGSSLPMNMSFMRVLRIFRLIRIMRLVRILRFIGELRLLVLSIMLSLKSLLWTLVLIVLMIYVFSIYLTQTVADVFREEEDEELKMFFGSLYRSIVTCFQVITGGIDWDGAMRPLENKTSSFVGMVFCFYIAFSIFAMLNVITGVFVESALQSANQDKDVVTVNNMSDFFNSATGENGTMSWEDFQKHLDTQPMRDYFRLIDIDRSEARGVFRLLDIANSGDITCDEFLSGCIRLRGTAKALDLALLLHEVRRVEMMVKSVAQAIRFSSTFLPEEEDLDGLAVEKRSSAKAYATRVSSTQ